MGVALVKVNDRGPFTKGVNLDLSAGAARHRHALDAAGDHEAVLAALQKCEDEQHRDHGVQDGSRP